MQEDAVSALTSLGLSQGEAKTYVALASVGSSEATPLAKIADVPQPRIYSYLDALVQQDLATKSEISGRPNVYSANEYEIVFNMLQEQLNSKIERAKLYLEDQQKSKNPEPAADFVKVILGRASILTSLESLSSTIDNNVFILNHKELNKIVDRIFKGKSYQLINPIDIIKDSPIYQNIANSPLGQTFGKRQIMLVLPDVDLMKPTVSSVNIVAFPQNDENIEPLMIQITHPLIIDLQVRVMTSVLKGLTGFDLKDLQ